MNEENNVEMENSTQHIEDVSLIRHELDSAGDMQSRDLAQMGTWDLNPVSSRGPAWN